jgi:hypothetical protein
MHLIIALILIFIVGVKVFGEKCGEMQYNSQHNKENSEREAWITAHTDRQLEERLKRYIANPECYDDVVEEIVPVFKGLEHWASKGSYLLILHERYMPTTKKAEEHRKMVNKNRKIALDILLANRGKVSTDSALWGYRAYLERDGYGADELKKSQFELVQWIRNTLNNEGENVELMCSVRSGCSTYYWVGTKHHLAYGTFAPFSEDLLK